MPDITEMPELERKSMLKDLDVPSVRDRDPDPESGPRLNVLKFKLQGIVEYPELGITKKDIDGLIESIRSELMQEYKVEKSGYTKKELEEVSDLLIEIEEETMERHVSDLEVQKLVWLIREQRSNRGITLGTIETVADRITQFYRERGFILAKAYIPRQEVRDGIVTLTLLLGTLGEVEVRDNELYSSEILSSVFDDMLASPVTSSAVEENLYLINDYPGVVSTGYFQPGAQVGDTKLNIGVKAEKNYDLNLRFDNHGSEQTGLYRIYGEALLHNPLGNGDQLQVSTLLTGKPSNTTYYQFRYSSYVFNPRFKLGIGASSNDFVLGPGNSETIDSLGIIGKTIQSDITASYSFKRSRTASYYGDLIYDDIESQTRLGDVDPGDESLDDIVKNLSFVFRYDILDEESKILHQGDVRLVSGDFVKGFEDGQDESYNILNLNYSLLTFVKVPFFDANSRIIYRASMQYASSALSSINQYSLAGPSRVRGYPVNQFSSDNAVYSGVDWIFDAPGFMDMKIGVSNLRNIVSPFVFMDAAWGQVISLIDTEKDKTGQLLDAGFGFQFGYTNNIHGNIQLAFPLSEKFTDTEINAPDDSFKLVFDFQYSFR
ncbi:MAG: hemolysin activator protein, HlyB family [endosymbiont of Galathealinum brachiosum]|uniref:Hemolysin activator protein, HlyB family n=1 Tax=endosymbiont of Galathealinum brachiosum TaxID=2200906 RepID=A0A370DG08_9GAMM|nr:MAG: hemolysin activator protein, HlyB family [endosymbiont of Galathealinum brachiosum]